MLQLKQLQKKADKLVEDLLASGLKMARQIQAELDENWLETIRGWDNA